MTRSDQPVRSGTRPGAVQTAHPPVHATAGYGPGTRGVPDPSQRYFPRQHSREPAEVLESKRLGIAAGAADRIVPVDRLAIGLDRCEQNRLLLRYWVGLTHKEPAQVLDEPEGTIRRRTAEALARLREREEQ